ncbi:MAG TPA: cytochrome c3 family protein [Vicinamibacterales bacterium]|nr:cytochrome c3 family protein [Vicinamibacterales bacterium]
MLGPRFTRLIALCVFVLAGGVGCSFVERNVPKPASAALLPGQSADVFTTARPTFAAALNDFLDRRPAPVQPLEFPHYIHVQKKIACTENCHESVLTGPVAGLPSVRTCMGCHNSIATDRPRIQRITQMRKDGVDLAWQRVFGYTKQAHVKFNHAPHIRKEIACATCHGNIAEQTVAQRNVDLNMGFCVNCHRQRNAPTDCLTCHF